MDEVIWLGQLSKWNGTAGKWAAADVDNLQSGQLLCRISLKRTDRVVNIDLYYTR